MSLVNFSSVFNIMSDPSKVFAHTWTGSVLIVLCGSVLDMLIHQCRDSMEILFSALGWLLLVNTLPLDICHGLVHLPQPVRLKHQF